MKRPSKQTERWLIGILGVVCVGLIFSLARRIFSGATVRAAAPTGQASQALAGRKGHRGGAAKDDLARYDPSLDLALLKQIETHPLPDSSRNPFEYPPPPPKPAAMNSGPAKPAGPPPPPPLPLKAIGYSVKEGGVPQAVVSDEQDIYVVHNGETFAKRYRVLSLTPNKVEIQDATTQQTVDLPIAP